MSGVEWSPYFKGVDQSLFRDGVKAFRASAVVTEPYVMAKGDDKL
jgi:hypothetical protein